MSSTQSNQLNFDLLPSLECGSMFSTLQPALDRQLQKFPATYDRANGALSFSAKICNTTQSDDGSDTKLREAFLRAALGEFVSMEEAIFYDAPYGGHAKIVLSENPLLHILKQLRNMQFHLVSSSLNTSEKDVVWDSQKSVITLWHVDDISVENFDRLRDSKHYAAEDKTQLISWFNASQKEWGINQLILEAVNTYAAEILA